MDVAPATYLTQMKDITKEMIQQFQKIKEAGCYLIKFKEREKQRLKFTESSIQGFLLKRAPLATIEEKELEHLFKD